MAYKLAMSEWYYDPSVHQCPHDGWLETFTVGELATGERHEHRVAVATIRLLGAYHDGYIELQYPQMFAYDFRSSNGSRGQGEWLYDEFRLSDAGNVVHEIEWANGGRWIIIASDVVHSWIPVA
jgi:hypothetical protein